MEKWEDNKKVHDSYWGKLYNHLINNPRDINDVTQQWFDLFKFELGNRKSLTYIDEGQTLTVDIMTYIENKNKSLQKVIDKHVTKDTDVIVDLGSGWGRHSIQLSFRNDSYKLIKSGRNSGCFHIEKSENTNNKTIRLDELNINSKIDFIKIDTEGSELYVLEGAINTINKNKPLIQVETNKLSEINFNYDKSKIYNFLYNLGYVIYDDDNNDPIFIYNK